MVKERGAGTSINIFISSSVCSITFFVYLCGFEDQYLLEAILIRSVSCFAFQVKHFDSAIVYHVREFTLQPRNAVSPQHNSVVA